MGRRRQGYTYEREPKKVEWHTPVDALCKAATDKAVLIEIDEEEYWIPKSQIDSISSQIRNQPTTIVMSLWIAKEKGIIE